MQTFFRAAVIAAMLFPCAMPAQAVEPIRTSVFSERDGPNHVTCKANHAAAIETTEQALRANGQVVIPFTDSTLSRDAVLAYVSLNPLPVTLDGEATGMCAVAVKFELYGNNTFINPTSGAEHFGKVMYCNRDSLIVTTYRNVRSMIATDLESMVAQCMGEYEASKI